MKLTPGQSAVYAVVKQHGPLADHILVPVAQHESGSHLSSSGIRSRRAELADKKLVKPTGTVKMPSGREAVVWDVV
jgi:hypothetical protein